MGRSRLRLIAYVALVVLVLVNIFLIGRLLGYIPDPRVGATATTPTTATTEPGTADSSPPSPSMTSPPPTSEPPAAPTTETIAGRRMLAVTAGLEAWRATAGACGAPSSAERTVDGGLTWTPVTFELGPITRLRVLTDGSVAAVGGDAACEPAYLSSADGQMWTARPELLIGSWYLMPADPARMMSPLGEVDVHCTAEAVDLAGLDTTRAAVRCLDSSAQRTVDSGATWDAVRTDGPVLAVAADEQGYVLATTAPVCEGVTVTTLGPDSVATDGVNGCAPLAGDQVAVARSGSAVWLWVEEGTVVSTDGGVTW